VALETKLALKTTQRLVMTAMLQQAIKLLPLSRLELVQKVQQEMLENPFLEDAASHEEGEVDLADEPFSQETEEEPPKELDIDWEAYLQDSGGEASFPVDNEKEFPSLEATLKNETSLTEYLLWQLSLAVYTEIDKQIGTYLIGNIDDDGYLQCQIQEVVSIFGLMTIVLRRLRSFIFDPAGVGARDLQECLFIQRSPWDGGVSCRDDYPAFPFQIDEDFRKIAKDLDVPLDEVIKQCLFVNLILSLKPLQLPTS
jgi:RNA polymerase sigma-54 factor